MGMNSNEIFDRIMAYRNETSGSVVKEEKPLKPSERMLLDLKNKGYNLSQLETVLKTSGNQLIVSCAGSGKTTALILKILYDIKTGRATRVVEVNGNPVRVPEKIWVCTFLKSGAEELQNALRKWQFELHLQDVSNAIQFCTLHAEFKRALNNMGIATEIISETENNKLLKDVLKTYSLVNGDGKPLTSEDISNLAGALTRTRNRLDNDRYTSDLYDELNIGYVIIDSILRDWKFARRSKGYYDFEDLQETLYEECYVKKNAEVIDYLSKRFSYIYIDEFQDTSQIQYELIKVYCEGAKQIIAIGDDDQTIYSWRGSCNEIITKYFMEDFNPIRNDLSINFRCPKNILDSIRPSIERNKNRFEKSLTSSREGGVVRVGKYANYKNMAQALSDMVYEDVKEGRSVAILCRVNSDGLLPALIMDRADKFYFSISGDGMTLDSYIGRLVLSIIKLFTERCTNSVRRALELLTWDTWSINELMRVCKANKISFWTIDEEDLKYSCAKIYPVLKEWRDWRRDLGDIEALKLVLQYYRCEVFVKSTQFNDVARSVLLSMEAMVDYSGCVNVEDFLTELDEINERLKARKKKSNVQIRIATVHEFKGKEADSVYVWNDSEGIFPYRKAEGDDALEEERRVHYIACTRARKKSTIMYLNNKQGLFVSEMDLKNAENIEGQTSGVVHKIIKGKADEDLAFRHFEEVCREDRYENAEDEFQEKMRRK